MSKSYSLNEYAEIINAYLEKALPQCDFGEAVVHEAMNYSLSIGGKRIRPVLVLEFCRVCGGNIEDALCLAAALEMVHTYSLIHDDLPCMDNDDMRRGMPSCHIKYGYEYALLAGDGLLTQAFGVIADSEFAKKNPALAIKAVAALSSLAGANGMIGGQVIDLKNENRKAGLETISKMDELKTGALIKCAALFGCIAAGADEEKIKAATEYATKIGQAFQIVDDILDVTGDEKNLGKPIGSDKESGKSTYYTLLGLEKAQEYADRLTDEATRALEIFGKESEFLKELAFMLAKRKH
ncbi:MAG: polyprenyl synthetase family protein [Clostridia bacterium]|nr:polyprenyl synthetase family protein [Clostridia bacterium]